MIANTLKNLFAYLLEDKTVNIVIADGQGGRRITHRHNLLARAARAATQ